MKAHAIHLTFDQAQSSLKCLKINTFLGYLILDTNVFSVVPGKIVWLK